MLSSSPALQPNWAGRHALQLFVLLDIHSQKALKSMLLTVIKKHIQSFSRIEYLTATTVGCAMLQICHDNIDRLTAPVHAPSLP